MIRSSPEIGVTGAGRHYYNNIYVLGTAGAGVGSLQARFPHRVQSPRRFFIIIRLFFTLQYSFVLVQEPQTKENDFFQAQLATIIAPVL